MEHILVKFRQDTKITGRFKADFELEDDGEIPEIRVKKFKVPPGKAIGLVRRLKQHLDVEDAEVDGEIQGVPMEVDTGTFWHLRQIRAHDAHNLGFRGVGAKFGIIDSGYKHAEPYFAGRISGERNFVITANPDGTVSDATSTEDKEGHGSACLELGIHVGPGAQCWVGRVMSANKASWSNVAAGALWIKDYVTAFGCSICGSGDSFTLRDAAAKVREKGVAWICAAGNQGSSTRQYPAATAGNCAITATNGQDLRCSFGNFGEWVHATAPGDGLVTILGTLAGTSGSCPQFTMVVAMVAEKFGITGLQALERVLATCRKLSEAGLGAGRVDLLAALDLAAVQPPAPPTTTQPPPPMTTDQNPPSKTAQPTITEKTSTGFRATWAAAQDNVGVVKHRLYLDTVAVQDVPMPGLTWLFTGLQGGRTYIVQIRGVDAAGNQGPHSDPLHVSLPVSSEPPAPPPPPPPLSPLEQGILDAGLTGADADLARTINGVIPDTATINAQPKLLAWHLSNGAIVALSPV